MPIIYNFSELPEDELQQFADQLVQKINSEHLFISDVDFKIDRVSADEMSGDLCIELSHDGLIEVPRKATWHGAEGEDELYLEPELRGDYIFYEEDVIYSDAKKVFKTKTIELDGYHISLELDDVDNEEIIDYEVDKYTREDSGIGRYEFWGEVGYDSHPYLEIEGTIIIGCTCYCSLWVEPAQ